VAEVRLARRAVKDLDSLAKKAAANVITAIEKLGANPSDPNLDVKPLAGHRPWKRLRIGNYRVVFQLSDVQRVLLIGRIVDRKELDQAVKTLPE
jgi:mRNA interferase RelE/StbE